MATPATEATPTCLKPRTVEGEDEKYIIRIRKRADKTSSDATNDAEKGTSVDGACDKQATISDTSSSQLLNDSAPVSPIHLSLQEEVEAGAAVVRSIAHFEVLDSQLRQEILGSATASVNEDGTFLGPLPRRKAGERYRSLAHPLEEFLEAVLRIPSAVRSDAMASFLTTDSSSVSEEESRQHLYHDYLLPRSAQDSGQAPVFYTIPRFGTFDHTIEPLPAGWWIVWHVQIESGTVDLGGQVEFSVYIDQPSTVDKAGETTNKKHDVDTSLEEAADCNVSSETCRWHELVHREECSIPSDEPFTGSYRFSPDVSESARATLQFVNVGSLSFLGGSRVQLECAAVPHEAFRAACEAAREQNDADARRYRAPLLYDILDSTEEDNGGIHLLVEPFPEQHVRPPTTQREDDDGGDAEAKESKIETPEPPSQSTGKSHRMIEMEEELKKLRAEVVKLHKDREYIRGELGRITKMADDGKRKLQLMVSEKRVWSVAREEIHTELSRLSTELAEERQAKSDVTVELETSKREVQRLCGEVKFLECTAPTEEDENRQKELVENAQSAVNEMKSTVSELEVEVESLKSKNHQLEKKIENQKRTYKERLVRARGDVDEAKMNQRILEGKVRHLEQELRRKTEGLSPRRKGNKSSTIERHRTLPSKTLDPKVSSFQHPDGRLNKQLSSLRERHAQLVVLLEQNPNNERNMELIGKIEKAIHDIVANAQKKSASEASQSS